MTSRISKTAAKKTEIKSMASRRKSRTMGQIIPDPSIPSSSTRRIHAKSASSSPPKSKYNKPKPPSDGICYYQNHILFSCLCIWSLFIIIWLFSNYMTSHSTTPMILSSNSRTYSPLLSMNACILN